MNYDFDLFVIGGGSGGVRAARMAAAQGKRVALAEGQALGGTCVNVGCIPKKIYSFASQYGEGIYAAREYGWDVFAAGFRWEKLKSQQQQEIARLNGVYRELLERSGVVLLNDWARVIGPHTVGVHQATMSARHILIATGGRPDIPSLPGRELCLVSDDVFNLSELPDRLAIVGSGYIACEFASIFSGLGVEVHLLYRNDRILTGFDHELAQALADELARSGIILHNRTRPYSISRSKEALVVAHDSGNDIAVDQVLLATGRRPNVKGLGLEEVGVRVADDGAIIVDEFFRTSVPSIFAIGDVIGRALLTPVALAEAMSVVEVMFPDGVFRRAPIDYASVPTAIFTNPGAASCGLTEKMARMTHSDVQIFKTRFRSLKSVVGGKEELTFMKIVVDGVSDKVLGVHMVGREAGEIIQGFAVAMQAGATKAHFDATVGVHPTVAEEFVTMRQQA